MPRSVVCLANALFIVHSVCQQEARKLAGAGLVDHADPVGVSQPHRVGMMPEFVLKGFMCELMPHL